MLACIAQVDLVDVASILKALKECSLTRDQKRGKLIHQFAIRNGDIRNIYVANTLLNMYTKCGCLTEARKIFDELQYRNVVSWNALMFGYAENGQGQLAFDLFHSMLEENVVPNATTYVAALKGCIDLASKEDGDGRRTIKAIKMADFLRSEILKNGCKVHSSIACTLVKLYAKCGNMLEARTIFDKMPYHDVVSWTTLILGYADNGQGDVGLEIFVKLLQGDWVVDSKAYIAALKACTDLSLKEEPILIHGRHVKLKSQQCGMTIHSLVVHEEGCQYIGSTLIDMYAKCGSIKDAHNMFDRIQNPSVVCWTALITGYADNGEGEIALELFACMKRQGCVSNFRTYIAALKACTDIAIKEAGKRVGNQLLLKQSSQERGIAVHFEAVSRGSITHEMYFANTLVDMYAKCGNMVDAKKVFDTMKHPSVVSWTALIQGYADNGGGNESLELFRCMQRQGCAPNTLTYLAALKACSAVGALEFGKALHVEVSSRSMLDNTFLVSLVDFYGKCGSVAEAQQVFDSVIERSISAWNALIGGYGRLGDTAKVFDLFHRMQEEKVQPDAITFLCVLTACAHAGLLDKGRNYFESMVLKYGIHPDIEHYTCMIDLLGKANELDEAVALLKGMPCSPDIVVWKRLMDACLKWKNEVVGKYVFDCLMQLDNKDAGGYVLMTNMHRT